GSPLLPPRHSRPPRHTFPLHAPFPAVSGPPPQGGSHRILPPPAFSSLSAHFPGSRGRYTPGRAAPSAAHGACWTYRSPLAPAVLSVLSCRSGRPSDPPAFHRQGSEALHSPLWAYLSSCVLQGRSALP